MGGTDQNKILIVGDVHGEFGILNSLINNKKPDILIACGDFGYWPEWDRSGNFLGHLTRNIKPQETTIYWCDGNHEHHDNLSKLVRSSSSRVKPKPVEVEKQVFYCPRGTILPIENENFLFLGGADSIDKGRRRLGVDWFRQEVISPKDFARIPKRAKIGTVISHTAPECLLPDLLNHNPSKYNDPSPKALQAVLEAYRPKRWFFGHWHIHREWKRSTHYTALGAAGYPAKFWAWY